MYRNNKLISLIVYKKVKGNFLSEKSKFLHGKFYEMQCSCGLNVFFFLFLYLFCEQYVMLVGFMLTICCSNL